MHSANGSANGHLNGHAAPLFYTSHPVYHEGAPVNRWEALLGATDLTGNATTLSRADLRNRGIDQRRDIDADCGYPSSISPSDYQRMYERDAIASRVVEVMPKESWAVQPTVYETEDPNDVTEFEEAWDALGKGLGSTRSFYQDESGSAVWSYLLRADVLAGIGQYGVILLGLDDGLDLSWPVDGFEEWNSQPVDSADTEAKKLKQYVEELGLTEEQAKKKLADLKRVRAESEYASGRTTAWTIGSKAAVTVNSNTGGTYVKNRARQPFVPEEDGLADETGEYKVKTPKEGKKGKRKLLYLRVFGEASASIAQFESNRLSPRNGQPTQYTLTLNSGAGEVNGVGLPTQTLTVHWTRVIHVVDYSGSTTESEVFHVPRMRPVFNRLIDLQRVYAGGTEGYWQACIGKLFVKTNPQLGGNVNVNESALKNMFEHMRHGTSREGVLKGLEPVLITPTPPDPTPFIAALIESICVNLACPVPVFKGYEIGEQASTNNSEKWNGVIQHRWVFHNGPRIIVPVVDRLILCGVLPEPKAAQEEPEQPEAMKKDNPSEGVGPPIKGATPPAPPQAGPPGKPKPPTANAIFTKRYYATVMVYNADTEEMEPETKQVGTSTVVKTRSGYSIEWPELDSQDATTKATNIGTLTSALAAYAGPGNAPTVMPPMEYFTKVWGRDEEEVAEMMDAAAGHVEDQQAAAAEQQQAAIDSGLAPDPTKPPPGPPGSHPDDANPDSNPFRTPTGNAAKLKAAFADAAASLNAFCSTGKGGGVDPTCGKGGGEATGGGAGGAGGKGADAGLSAHGPAHGKPAASPNVTVSYGGDQTKITAAIRSTFGKDVHPNTLAGAANALDGADVHISTTAHSGLLQVVVRNKNGSEAKRTFYKDHRGELVCDNGAFNNKVKEGHERVPGAEMLKGQVQHLREIGVSKIVTQAEGSKADPKGYVGYTVWPKLGYDGQMTEGQFKKLPPEVQTAMGAKKGFLGLGGNKGSRSVMALHNTPGGPEAWAEHGSTFDATFDLKDGSANMKALDKYLSKKKGQ